MLMAPCPLPFYRRPRRCDGTSGYSHAQQDGAQKCSVPVSWDPQSPINIVGGGGIVRWDPSAIPGPAMTVCGLRKTNRQRQSALSDIGTLCNAHALGHVLLLPPPLPRLPISLFLATYTARRSQRIYAASRPETVLSCSCSRR